MQQRDKLSVWVPKREFEAGLLDKLERLARAQDRSVSYIVIQAVKAYLDRAEWAGRRRA
jgi:predicted transcriptional regulator